MKITDIEVISFRIPTRLHPTRWGYMVFDGEEHFGIQRITKISTDEGAVGFVAGGVHGFLHGATKAEVEGVVKPLLVGEDPLDRERLWQWMMGQRGFSEGLVGNIDCALWDLHGRMAGVPIAKLLGGAREKGRPTPAPRRTSARRRSTPRTRSNVGSEGTRQSPRLHLLGPVQERARSGEASLPGGRR